MSAARRRRRIGIAALAVLVAATLFVAVAPYNIAASVPHLPGVRWLLDTYLRNAVRTWSLGVERPADIDLDDPALLALGAAHFETGCAPCHGAPGRGRNPTVLGMRPAPPDLADKVGRFRDRELFWIVRNGFKYSGMPAWGAGNRPREPWAVAAFLRRYPELDADGYRALAYGPAAPDEGPAAGGRAVDFGGLTGTVKDPLANCARCHGTDGLGREGVAPRLAGQSAAFIAETLAAYAAGDRPSGFMAPVAASLSRAAIDRLARHYAELSPPGARGGPARLAHRAGPDAPSSLLAEGARLARTGKAERDVPACLACHGPGPATERREVYPHIAGQHRAFLERWLRLWREGAVGGTAYAGVMHEAARTLTDRQIEALAAWYAAGAPESAEPRTEAGPAEGPARAAGADTGAPDR